MNVCPLTTLDWCTLWPDRFMGIDYSHCCALHDIAYEMGSGFMASNLHLGACVAEQSAPVMGLAMAIGTTVCGFGFYGANKRRAKA